MVWAKNLDEDGKVLWNLGPLVLKIWVKMSFFWPWGCPKEAQDGAFKGAIFEILECLQTILFTTLQPPRRSHGPSLRTAGGAFSEGFLRSFEEVRC